MLRRVRSPNRLVLADCMLGKIETPTTFLWGENDPFGSADTARRLIARMANAELEMLPSAGHAPWLDNPDHCAKTIGTFLRRSVDRGSGWLERRPNQNCVGGGGTTIDTMGTQNACPGQAAEVAGTQTTCTYLVPSD
jgi:hypothetical protein